MAKKAHLGLRGHWHHVHGRSISEDFGRIRSARAASLRLAHVRNFSSGTQRLARPTGQFNTWPLCGSDRWTVRATGTCNWRQYLYYCANHGTILVSNRNRHCSFPNERWEHSCSFRLIIFIKAYSLNWIVMLFLNMDLDRKGYLERSKCLIGIIIAENISGVRLRERQLLSSRIYA